MQTHSARKVFLYVFWVSLGCLAPSIASSENPLSQPASQPTTQPASQPASQPTTTSVRMKPTRPKLAHRIQPKARATPKRMGMLSIAMSSKNEVWIDGLYAGKAPVSYLRVGSGMRLVELFHPKYGHQSFTIKVFPARHSVLMRRGPKLGMRTIRKERTQVFIRRFFPQRSIQAILHPGPLCIRPKTCIFLAPGEQLDLRTDGKHRLYPSAQAITHGRAYRPTPGHGTLHLVSFPPGVLLLNNQAYTPTPVARLSLPPGTYKAVVKNHYMQVAWKGEIRIQAQQQTRHIVFLAPQKGGHLQIRTQSPSQLFVNGLYRGWSPNYTLPLPAGSHQISAINTNGPHRRLTISLRAGERKKIRIPNPPKE